MEGMEVLGRLKIVGDPECLAYGYLPGPLAT